MSQKLITIDDHAGTPIDDAQTAQTQARISIAREGTGEVIEWDALNLSDESWDELIKTLREFCPEREPNMSGESHAAHVASTSNQRIALMEADAAATAQAQALEAAAAAEAAPKVPAAAPAPAAKVPAPRASSASTVKLSQGEARKRSAAVRSWWQSLTPAALKALSLPEAKSGPGKMPVAVYDAYNAAHQS